MESRRKREGKGRSAEYEGKRPKVEADSGTALSDVDTSLAIHESDTQYEGEVSPYHKMDTEYFPLVKTDAEGGGKKLRRYRGGGSDREKSHHSGQERERTKEHKKHRSDRPRRARLSPSPGSGHKSHEIRSSGHNSPHMYEGRRSHDEGKWSHDYQGRERVPAHSYKSDREEGYRRGDRMMHPKGRYEGRRGSGAGAPPTNLHGPRPHRDPHRSPLVSDDMRRRGREEREFERIPAGGSDRRGREGGYAHQKVHIRRERPLMVESHYVESSSEESLAEEGRQPREERVFTLHPEDFQNLLERERGRGEGDSRSTSDSSEGSGSDQGEEGELRGEESGRAKKRRTSSGCSVSGDSSHERSISDSRSAGSHSPQSDDQLSLPYVMRSKFDSDAEDSGEGTDPVSPLARPVVGLVGGPSDEREGEDKEKQQRTDQEEAEKKEEEATEKQRFSQFLAELGSDKEGEEEGAELSALPCFLPGLMGCRNVESYEWLNRIEEGTYGVVHRAKDKKTGEIVALKKLKMEKEKEGFPITSLREINMLLKAKHPNVVHVREIVVGSNMDKIYIVMEYVEHDLKALMEIMPSPFLQGEVKTLLIQLLRAVHHLHDNWILHRDLKASNLLLSHKGILKVGDFGLAREYGSPLKNYTPVVVTLWYRSPELLLGAKEYSTAVDMWSVGCIFAEFLQKEPLFRGKSEIDQINLIFKELGTPNERIWPGYGKLPTVEKVTFTTHPYNNLRKKFPPTFLTESGFNLINRFLTYDPKKRITALEALDHKYFSEPPAPVPPSLFPTWPAKSEMSRSKRREKSPKPPEGGINTFLGEDEKPAGAFYLKA